MVDSTVQETLTSQQKVLMEVTKGIKAIKDLKTQTTALKLTLSMGALLLRIGRDVWSDE